ncbi:tRNA dihydrouridine synthase DusB [Christensenellaceae bacterium OttesenSCG-928-L17]|nr:tRNA dihydrouridine synthase DusB [Christensenellaceae bacterium OttesenSCG-928-L17]
MKFGDMTVKFPVALAPMAGITDMPFRLLCKEMGCDWAYTEMISAKGLNYQNEKTKQLLHIAPDERPSAVQLFGSDPDILADMAKRIAAEYAEEIALIDINMGCPAHKIVSNGEGSALMNNLPLAARIIEKTADAVRLPVTVKFRKGWDDEQVNAVAFARMAEESGAAAVAVHGRTRAQGYSGTADWDIIGEVKAAVRIPVLGNGDIYTAADALRMRAHTGCDGVLVARGAQGNPFVFREIASALRGEYCPPASVDERLHMALRHAQMQVAFKGAHGIVEMRKHIAWYIKGMPRAAQMRVRVNSCKTLEELAALLEDIKNQNDTIQETSP